MAVVAAVKMSLEKAGLGIEQMKAIKTHNPSPPTTSTPTLQKSEGFRAKAPRAQP
jgi:hypothetical protein